MREKWAAEIDARARAHWTPERTHGLLGDKNLILPPADFGPLLRCLDLLKADASMSPESVRKYMQVSHVLTLLEPQMRDLAERNPLIRVVDLACGNSYLTFTLATSLRQRIRHPAHILGVDRNARLVEACRERAWRLDLDAMLRFESSNIDRLDLDQAWQRAFDEPAQSPHLLVALHACDTATDDALALGISMNVPALAVVPCCQGELAKMWSQGLPEKTAVDAPDAFQPIRQWPHLRREIAATMTDALRTLILRGCGYDASPIEFVPSSHTPKNTMIRANRRSEGSPELFREYVALRDAIGGARIRLEVILPEPHRTHLRVATRSPEGS
jgi:SAM-dependent methyltransferase